MVFRSKPPLVFRLAGALLIVAIAFGQWWQHRPAGQTGRSFLALVAQVCPAAAYHGERPDVADTAHALDQWFYAQAGDLLFRDSRDRCRKARRPSTRKAAGAAR